MIEIKDLILHPIQLVGVELVSCNLSKKAMFDDSIILDDMSVSLKSWSDIDEKNKKFGYSYLNLIIDFDDKNKPFFIEMTYRGVCLLENDKYTEAQFRGFLEAQGLKLLWPYIKPALADFMVKMDIDPLNLPTLDVLKTMGKSKLVEEEN